MFAFVKAQLCVDTHSCSCASADNKADGGSLSFTFAVVPAERAKQRGAGRRTVDEPRIWRGGMQIRFDLVHHVRQVCVRTACVCLSLVQLINPEI